MQDYSVLDVLSNKKVLCLEDEPYILKNMIDSLELFFAEVKGVSDGIEALDEAMSGSYDALVLDVSVPHMDGLEVAKKIRCANHKIPIVIISSHTEQEYLWRAVELKITRYLSKPYDKDTFIKALEDVAMELIDHTPMFSINSELKYDFSKKIIYKGRGLSPLQKRKQAFGVFFKQQKPNYHLRAAV